MLEAIIGNRNKTIKVKIDSKLIGFSISIELILLAVVTQGAYKIVALINT